ncbi:MAG: hypothetical protein V7629_09355 [Motiliproteus sp.]
MTRLNPATLVRTDVADTSWAQDVEVDSLGRTALVTDRFKKAVWMIDLATGQKEEKIMNTVTVSNGLAYDEENRTAYFLNASPTGLWALDTATGVEAVIAK